MAVPTMEKLIVLQSNRENEISLMRLRLVGRSRDTLSKAMIRSRIDSLNKIWEEARATHTEILLKKGSENDPYVTDDKYRKMQALFEDAHDELLVLLEQFETPSEATTERIPSDVGTCEMDKRVAKLPKLDLPKFTGKYEDWDSFADLFTNLVHNAPGLADATKLQYLKSCLTDSAADLVKNVATTNANYISTWNALRARFDNPRLIVNTHINALFNLTYLKRDSATEWRNFTDEVQRIVRALSNMRLPVEHWDVWLVYIVSSRMDPESRKMWESELSAADRATAAIVGANAEPISILDRLPKYHVLVDFLEKRTQMLSMLNAGGREERRPVVDQRSARSTRRVLHVQRVSAKSSLGCPLCPGKHPLGLCFRFKTKSPRERNIEVRRLKLCFNCFGTHRYKECQSLDRCSVCRAKHHTLLHFPGQNAGESSSRSLQGAAVVSSPAPAIVVSDANNTHVEFPNNKETNVKAYTAAINSSSRVALLATAVVILTNPNGKQIRARALLDQGSEATFVTEDMAQRLDLNRICANINLSGVGAMPAGRVRASTRLMLRSESDPNCEIETTALILPRLTSLLPSRDIFDIDLSQFRGVKLADPQFFKRKTIDVILGVDVYGRLLREGLKTFAGSDLVAQNTVFGWMLSGPVRGDASRRADGLSRTSAQVLHCKLDVDLSDRLQQFWQLEEIPESRQTLTDEEQVCETLFRECHTRSSDGRYTVRLPVKEHPPARSVEARTMALNSLSYNHRRFSRDATLAEAYKNFIANYESLGHMEKVPESEKNDSSAWYLPHHAVFQNTIAGRKIRVVFDASRRTREGEFLNSYLLPGPALQRDLSLVLLNWRRYKFVFTADIVKMFRQIRVAQEDRHLQRIVWSTDPNEEPVDYQLTTVTYGTACAPYLAIRTLMQLAEDERARFPMGARCVEQDTYVDDTFSGANELSSAIKIRDELIALLRSAGIELDKWSANHHSLLPTAASQAQSIKEIDPEVQVKTLGILWNPAEDEFTFSGMSFEDLTRASSKRLILSNISRLFDPLGWLTPITIVAKILIQDLWITKTGWDEPLPTSIQAKWIDYCKSLASLSGLSLKRWLDIEPQASIQIHAFSDASSRAYATAVYLRIVEETGRVHVHLIASKTKVAPIKTISIPNLELCATVLLIKLVKHVQCLDFLQGLPIYAWTDSQIVLMWLKKHPRTWKTFVANRVSMVQTELPAAVWAHVASQENPADLATRGVSPEELIRNNLWWHGPTWLTQSSDFWPKPAEGVTVLTVRRAFEESDLLTRFSSLTRLIRIVAYCMRPLVRLRMRKAAREAFPTFLTASELSHAREIIIRMAQINAFASEIELLKAGKSLPKRSVLKKLNPFYDVKSDLLRVGGRLGNASLTYNCQHPPILPSKSALSKLFVRYAHLKCLHGGPMLTSSVLLRFVWIIGRMRLVKSSIRNCVVCQRNKPKLAHQLMGQLPRERVTPARPFSVSGLDYAGPVSVRTSKGRGQRSYKGYIVIFVCFSTRAVHLEAVSDLTTATFLAAFRRFVGRRGVCHTLFSDNASTFQGADRELRHMFRAASDFYKDIAFTLSNDGTTWKFIPPGAPHYGGLWEAGVRSTKHHLKRTIGDHTFTFEELSTLLVQVEACLNSRPLTPMSDDPEDLQTLTPAHFLIGETSALIPDEAPPQVPENRLVRYQLLQRLLSIFWKRWSGEYMQHLQERGRWRDPVDNFTVGKLVLMQDDRFPPAKWPLGRVIEVHPGPDGLVRVVTIKAKNNTFKRHVSRLCPLSLDSDSRDEIKTD